MSDPAAPSPLPPEPPAGSSAATSAGAPTAAAEPSAPSALPEGTGLTPNLAATLAAFFLLVGGIVFLILEKKNQYVRFYAMQSVFLGGVVVALSIGMSIVMILLSGIPLIGTVIWLAMVVVRLAVFVGWVVLIVKAYSGKEWEIPYLGKLAREQLTPKPPTGS